MELYLYQHLIGKLIYLTCCTWPNITFITGQLSKYNSDSKKDHLEFVKRVIQYLKEIMQLGLIYRQRPDKVDFRD